MKKILVCEDESAIRDFVVINLKRAGYDGYLTLEFEGLEDCEFGIKAGLNYIKTLI